MTRREIIYIILDEIKATNGDSFITEEHVSFLLNIYRSFLLELKRLKTKFLDLGTEYLLEICLNVETVNTLPDIPCYGNTYLKSTVKVPSMLYRDYTRVYAVDLFNTIITYVPIERFANVGYNKYMGNIIYATIGADKYLYLKSNNPLFTYLQLIKVSGIFEDADKADELSCSISSEGESTQCTDPLDKEFPIAADLVPQLIEFLVKELKTALYTLEDRINDSADTISDLVNYIRHNMKSDLAKQLTT